MDQNSVNTYSSFDIINLMDEYIDSFITYNKNTNNKINKNNCINITKTLHEILVKNYNFIKIADSFAETIDKYIEKNNDLNSIILAMEYLFKDIFFDYLLALNKDNMSDHHRQLFHCSLALILINKLTLYHKYADEEIDDLDDRKNFIITILPNIVTLLEKIYKDAESKEGNEFFKISKDSLMELLCNFDLEDIYNKE